MAEAGTSDARARERERRRQRLEGLAPLLVALIGGLGSAILWRTMRQAEAQAARSVFELSSEQRAARVQREGTAALEQLRSVAALFDSSDTVEAGEFHTFTARTLERDVAVRGLLWIERGASPGEPPRPVFAEGDEAERLAARDEVMRSPELGLALARAGGGPEPALSAPLSLPETQGPRVFAAVPVRHHEGPLEGELQGWVVALLDPGRLLMPALQRGSQPAASLRIEDVTGGAPVLLAGALAESSLTYSPGDEDFGGRRWRITCAAPPGFVASASSAWPLAALAIGLLGTASAVASFLMATSRRRAQALVERRSGEVLQSYATLASESDERRHAMREAKASQEQLRQILDLVPNQIYVKDRHGRMLMANQATADAYGTSVRELTLPAEVDVNADVGEPSRELKADRALMNGNRSVIVPAQPFVDAEGRRRLLNVAKIPCRLQGSSALLYVATDVTEQRRAEEIVTCQNLLLGELARGSPPEDVLRQAIATAERLVPGLRCSVLFLSPDRRHLVHGLAPSLPQEYSRAVEGLAIGPEAGSCGAAAHLGRRFLVRDVQEHPNWSAYRDVAQRANIRACWSEPIRASDGEILGTFAMYYSEPRTPESYEERFIESMAYLAGIAIERGRLGAPA